MLAPIAEEISSLWVFRSASKASGVCAKVAILYDYLDTAHLMTSFSLRKQKSHRGSFSLSVAFSMDALMTCISKRYFFFKVLVGEEFGGIGFRNAQLLEFRTDGLVITKQQLFELLKLLRDVSLVDLQRDLEVLDDLIDGSLAYLFKIESIDIVGNNLANEEYEFFLLK